MYNKTMKKHFYSHIVETDTVLYELHRMEFSEEEKSHLISLVDTSLHHAVLDAILTELSEDDKRIFLTHVAHDEHGKIWNLLNEKVNGVEDKIQKAAEDLKKALYKDIKDAHNIEE